MGNNLERLVREGYSQLTFRNSGLMNEFTILHLYVIDLKPIRSTSTDN